MSRQNDVRGVVVDSRYMLVGLVVSRSGENQVHPESLANLRQSGFKTRKVAFNAKGGLVLSDRDALWDLPCYIMDAAGHIEQALDNSMKLTARILDREGPDATVIGYYVRICGREEPMRLETIVRLSGWIKPFNFVVRTDDATKKRFLAAKAGMPKLGDLPSYVGADSRGTRADARHGAVPGSAEATNKKVRAAVGSTKDNQALDIETLVAKVAELGGLLAMAPGEKYKQTGKNKQKAARFESIGASQVAIPKLEYNQTKLNANVQFRKRGQLILPNDAPIEAVDCFMWSTKHLFYNGRNQMDNLRVLIPADKTAEFETLVNSDFALRHVAKGEASAKDSGYAGDPYGTQGMVEYEVRLSKLSVIGFPHPGNEAIMPPEQLRQVVYTFEYIKLVKSVLNRKLKVLLGGVPELKAKDEASHLCPMYANLSPEALEYIQKMGVNISTGGYSAKKLDLVDDSDGSESLGGATPIEISYRMVGFNDKELTGDGKYGVSGEQIDLIRDYLVQAAKNIESTDDLSYQYAATKENIEYLDGQLKVLTHALWRHKVAMVIKGGGKIHTLDRAYWNEVKTRKAGGRAFECVKPGCEGLAMTISGVLM